MSEEEKMPDGEDEELPEEEDIEESPEGDGEDLSDDERKELEELRKKDFNFKKMRGNVKKTKEEVKKEREELDNNWSEFRDNLVKERKEDALALLVGDDEEMRKKVLHNFNRIDPDKPVVSKNDIYGRMKEATRLAEVNAQPNILSGGSHSGYRGDSKSSESETSKAIRKEFKISDEDKSKYGGGEWKPNY